MEAFLAGRVSKLGLDEEAFVPYLASLASDRESDEPLRDRLQTALENIGAENFDAFLNELVTFCESLTISEQHSREQQEAEARVQAEKALLATKVLRGGAAATVPDNNETPEERKKRQVFGFCFCFFFFFFFFCSSSSPFQELLARYDVPDEIVMDASGKVLLRDVSEKTQMNVDGNDNAERVRQAELEQV
jgi:hypothetical protein